MTPIRFDMSSKGMPTSLCEVCCDWDNILGNGKYGGRFLLLQELVKQGNRLVLPASRSMRFHPPVSPIDSTLFFIIGITPKHFLTRVYLYRILLVKAA